MMSRTPVKSHLKRALRLHALGEIDGARKCYREVLRVDPSNVTALGWLGTLEAQVRNLISASEFLGKAVSLSPADSNFLLNYANVLQELGRFEEAIKFYKRLLKLQPENLECNIHLANCFRLTKNFTASIETVNRMLSIDADCAQALKQRAIVLCDMGDMQGGLSDYLKSVSLDPKDSETWYNFGLSLSDTRNFEGAYDAFNKALLIESKYVEAWNGKGAALLMLNRLEEALSCFEAALQLNPDYLGALINKAEVLGLQKKHVLSSRTYLQAATQIKEPNRYFSRAHHQMMLACDWQRYEDIKIKIDASVEEGYCVAEPFWYQGVSYSEELLQKAAQIYCQNTAPTQATNPFPPKASGQKIRVGYLCGEFREQATSILLTGVWELHNRDRFELYAFDNGWPDGSSYRRRIESVFRENLFDISRSSDADVAALVTEKEIDILVNLNGYFGAARPKVFSYKPAPIQVNFLGFPGTLGAKYIDYIIADEHVIPFDSRRFYDENVIYLPFTYQPNDCLREVSTSCFTRESYQLPANSFIFCCFNNNYKITPEVFDLWAKILLEVENSCLWLLADNIDARSNLCAEIEIRGVSQTRLVFADRVPPPEHLGRQRLADLFLDTFPYNAHTTASDALWVGLPVLTLHGSTFPGRVGGSLLNAAGIPELVAHSKEEYLRLAIDLARDTQKLTELKNRLFSLRDSSPLFSTSQYVIHLEKAFQIIYERYSKGLQPEGFSVSAVE